MLDYKIQELKIQRGPKEQEIMNLKILTKTMDDEMMHFNKINTALGGIVDTLKTKQADFHHANHVNRLQVRQNDSYIQGFKTAVYWVSQYIDDYDQLKRAVHNSLYKYVKDQPMKNEQMNPDIQQENID